MNAHTSNWHLDKTDHGTMMKKYEKAYAMSEEMPIPTNAEPERLARARTRNEENGRCMACEQDGEAFQQCSSCGAPIEPKDNSWHYSFGWKKGPSPSENCENLIANIRDCSSGSSWELYTYTAVFRAPKSFKDVYKQCMDDTLQVQIKVDGGDTMGTEIADYRVKENGGSVK